MRSTFFCLSPCSFFIFYFWFWGRSISGDGILLMSSLPFHRLIHHLLARHLAPFFASPKNGFL
jgi:hypothetical protein